MTDHKIIKMQFVNDDGGRTAAGRKGSAGDCVARAIAIAAQRPYAEVYDALATGNFNQRRSKHDRGPRRRSASNGIRTNRKWFKDYMASLGFVWVPTMAIGSGCTTHLRSGGLPIGRLVVSVSGHMTAVIDGTIYDTVDPSRGGTRCVYGYWKRIND